VTFPFFPRQRWVLFKPGVVLLFFPLPQNKFRRLLLGAYRPEVFHVLNCYRSCCLDVFFFFVFLFFATQSIFPEIAPFFYSVFFRRPMTPYRGAALKCSDIFPRLELLTGILELSPHLYHFFQIGFFYSAVVERRGGPWNRLLNTCFSFILPAPGRSLARLLRSDFCAAFSFFLSPRFIRLVTEGSSSGV